jgi:hypothetical protein
MSTNQAGKGDKPRPVDKKEYDKNFDNIKWTTKSQLAVQETTKKGKTSYKY